MAAVADSLNPSEQRLVRVFTASALAKWDAVDQVRAEAVPPEPNRAWREALLMLHIFAGIPRQIEAFTRLSRNGGLGLPDPDEVTEEPDLPERGEKLFDRIYGKQAEKVYSGLHRLHPDFAKWVMGHAYGRVLTRPGLSPRMRELIAVPALAGLNQDRQMASHARGALRCGATREELRHALEVVKDLITPERFKASITLMERFAVL